MWITDQRIDQQSRALDNIKTTIGLNSPRAMVGPTTGSSVQSVAKFSNSIRLIKRVSYARKATPHCLAWPLICSLAGRDRAAQRLIIHAKTLGNRLKNHRVFDCVLRSVPSKSLSALNQGSSQLIGLNISNSLGVVEEAKVKVAKRANRQMVFAMNLIAA